jgi:hypothetical protein
MLNLVKFRPIVEEDLILEKNVNTFGEETLSLTTKDNDIVVLCLIPLTEDIETLKKNVAVWYNSYLSNFEFNCMYHHYVTHLRRCNDNGWERRIDFDTEDKYESFVKGLYSMLVQSIKYRVNAEYVLYNKLNSYKK